jgi:hypothetical protein
MPFSSYASTARINSKNTQMKKRESMKKMLLVAGLFIYLNSMGSENNQLIKDAELFLYGIGKIKEKHDVQTRIKSFVEQLDGKLYFITNDRFSLCFLGKNFEDALDSSGSTILHYLCKKIDFQPEKDNKWYVTLDEVINNTQNFFYNKVGELPIHTIRNRDIFSLFVRLLPCAKNWVTRVDHPEKNPKTLLDIIIEESGTSSDFARFLQENGVKQYLEMTQRDLDDTEQLRLLYDKAWYFDRIPNPRKSNL